jgi:hypothetical protein
MSKHGHLEITHWRKIPHAKNNHLQTLLSCFRKDLTSGIVAKQIGITIFNPHLIF